MAHIGGGHQLGCDKTRYGAQSTVGTVIKEVVDQNAISWLGQERERVIIHQDRTVQWNGQSRQILDVGVTDHVVNAVLSVPTTGKQVIIVVVVVVARMTQKRTEMVQNRIRVTTRRRGVNVCLVRGRDFL
jgi:hypothetical protein